MMMKRMMIKILPLCVAALLLASPVLAEGMSSAEGLKIALEEYPGELLEDQGRHHNLYQYRIRQEDGSRARVSVHLLSGEVTIEPEIFDTSVKPENRLNRQAIREIVRDYVRKEIRGGRHPDILKTELFLGDETWLYRTYVEVDKVIYRVIADAISGEVLSHEKTELNRRGKSLL